ncbi:MULTISPECIES: hypothetical protein [Janthinobacterium]|uniref:hypothetical protein n=1 Tax=Janthinobacterium TaxID=29580 RepID=UPI00080674DF|nr:MULTISPECIES: hypothetical protein [Janthinobacterium]
MVDQNILQDQAFLGKTAFECRGKTTLISKDEDDIATPCLRFGQDRRLSTTGGHQLAHRFATTGLPDSDSPLLAESCLSENRCFPTARQAISRAYTPRHEKCTEYYVVMV